MKLNWYPGHMAKAFREIKENLKYIDLILYLLDSRIPQSSRNLELENLFKNKKVFYILTKTDLADPLITEKWIKYFKKQNKQVIPFNVFQNNSIKKLKSDINKIQNPPEIKILILGIPNIGKSTLINQITGLKKTKTGKLAGVTKNKQWISFNDFKFLDTPGIFFPKITNEASAWHLAATGAVKIENLPLEEITLLLINFLASKNIIAKIENFTAEKTALYIIKRFQDGKYGRISLEEPNV
ncbi:MAG: ribosome biogenesis GTPase YlqF [Armatimonadetes bacterium]|nr:ribosome biogenesis GTPase YlqF [Armatimonadota bacterium]